MTADGWTIADAVAEFAGDLLGGLTQQADEALVLVPHHLGLKPGRLRMMARSRRSSTGIPARSNSAAASAMVQPSAALTW